MIVDDQFNLVGLTSNKSDLKFTPFFIHDYHLIEFFILYTSIRMGAECFKREIYFISRKNFICIVPSIMLIKFKETENLCWMTLKLNDAILYFSIFKYVILYKWLIERLQKICISVDLQFKLWVFTIKFEKKKRKLIKSTEIWFQFSLMMKTMKTMNTMKPF